MTVTLDYNINPVVNRRPTNSRILEIEGQAIDATVNANLWQVPPEELDYFVENSQGVQIRVDHGDTVEHVKGGINILRREGDTIVFEGEVSGDEQLIDKILREYVNCVSPSVVGDFECSLCRASSRDANLDLVHLCAGAWEVVRHPRFVELSIVTKGAYEKCKFKPKGFAASVTANQQNALNATLAKRGLCAKCTSPTFACLACKGEHLQVSRTDIVDGSDNHKNQGEKHMSANPNPTESIQSEIAKHAATLAEACSRQIAEASKTIADACNKAIADAAAKSKLELQALIAQNNDALVKKFGAKSIGQGVAGVANEPPSHTFKLSNAAGQVFEVPTAMLYFKNLMAAAEDNRRIHGQTQTQGVS